MLHRSALMSVTLYSKSGDQFDLGDRTFTEAVAVAAVDGSDVGIRRRQGDGVLLAAAFGLRGLRVISPVPIPIAPRS